MTDPVALLSEYVRIDTSNPQGDRGAAGEGIEKMTRIIYAFIGRWNAAR